MYNYITGRLTELTPAEATVECAGFGYSIQISLTTYSHLQKAGSEAVKLYLYHHLREDDELFYGFFDTAERDIFKLLITVSGIGPNTARMMLSSMTAQEVESAILSQDVNKIKSVKGIGSKTADRVILELKDKVVKGSGSKEFVLGTVSTSPVYEEAQGALIMLGFAKPAIEKALKMVLKETPSATLEELIKKSLKIL